jgi:hypothetical protein
VKNSVRFLARFVLASALLFLLWTPISRVYTAFLSLEANAVFRLIGHHARFVSDHRGPHILYPDVFPPYQMKSDIRIPILQRIAVDYNLIVLVALFAATPGMSRSLRTRGIVTGVVLLSILHVAHIYYISYLFIWDYIDFKRWPDGIPARNLIGLIENARNYFPRGAQPYVKGLYDYWNHFVREGAPLLIWLYFVYPMIKDRIWIRKRQA